MKQILCLSALLCAVVFGAPWSPSQAQPFDPCQAQPTNPTPAVALTPVEDGFDQPVFLTHAGDGSDRLFVVEQPGLIRIVRDGQTSQEPFLDIRSRVDFGGEQGLLSMAFHPQYAHNGRFFVNYTARPDGRTVVAEYHVSQDADIADPTEKVVIEIAQPFANHNGGQLQFGPDGFLYVGMGDGGSGGDPLGNGQNLNSLLGKLLRIDVDGTEPYAIPQDNPFVGRSEARGEIYAYGLRNPWRFSFDRCDGRLFLADVGQGRIEEVDWVVKGGNYGWNVMEGSQCYPPNSFCVQGGLELPIHEYRHDAQGGNSITGGYVYRGALYPALAGRYFFADFVSARLWSLTQNAQAQWQSQELLVAPFNISSFGQDEDGELYVLGFDGGVYRLELAAPQAAISSALDVNGNHLVDDAEILSAVQLWARGAVVPGTSLVIDDAALRSVLHLWTTGARLG